MGTVTSDPLNRLEAVAPYTPVPLFVHQHGLVAGARYSPDPMPTSVLATLHEAEREAVASAGSAGAAAFAAGRIALRAALLALPRAPEAIGAIGRTERGAPIPPAGYVASVTHKDGIALALAAVDRGQCVGVDLETLTPKRKHLALRVLRDEELHDVEAVAPELRWREIMTRFSIKEAVYKAVDAYLSHTLDFKEVSVDLSQSTLKSDGFEVALVKLHSSRKAVPRILEATFAAYGNYVITTAQTSPVS